MKATSLRWVLAVAVLLAVSAIGTIWWKVFLGVRPHEPGPSVAVVLGMVPESGGTRVTQTVIAEAGVTLPSTLTLSLPGGDFTHSDRTTFTDSRLTYSTASTGAGRALTLEPGDQNASPRITGIPTDGRQATVRFHVATVAGRHVIYPGAFTGLNPIRLDVTGYAPTWTCDQPVYGASRVYRYRACDGAGRLTPEHNALTALRWELP